MSFDKLLEEFETLQKSMQDQAAEQDANIRNAAADGSDDEDEVKDPDDAKDGGKGEPFGKSFSANIDGQDVDVVDGTELVKSLIERLDSGEAKVNETLTKAMGVIKQQGEMLKSLGDRVAELATAGRGRKSSLTVNDRPAATELQKSQPQEGLNGTQVLAKCLQAQSAGRMTGSEVARVEAYINRGEAIPTDLAARIGS